MNKIHFILPAIDADDFTFMLGNAFGITPVQDFMSIPPAGGEGFVYRKKIHNDLFLVYWRFTLRKKLSVYRRPAPDGEKQMSISVIYILVPGGTDQQNGQNILLLTGESGIKFESAAGDQVKIIAIHIGFDWLKKTFSSSDKLYDTYFNALYRKINKAPFVYPANREDMRLLSEIARQVNTGSDSLLFLQAKILLLVSGLFSRIVNLSGNRMDKHKSLHVDQMIAFEKILTDHLEKKLPGLPSLAKSMSLSTSTLKRNFKLIFGKNIYHYYLALKMDYAMKILKERNLSVNEVAHLLHYENVSGFIAMFKKYHGISPGAVIKPPY